MIAQFRWILAAATVFGAALTLGCNPGSTPSAPSSTPNKPHDSHEGHDHPHSDPGQAAGEDHSAGTPLSAEDRALADAQKICPVSDEELGTMGPPIKEMVKGEPVFLCCKACIKKLHADEDKYVAKLAELKKSQPGEPEE